MVIDLLQIVSQPGPDPAIAFVEWAFGRGRPEFGFPSQHLSGIEMPDALRRYYEFAGRRPGMYTQNRIRHPDELRREGNRLVFYDENQHVLEWATAMPEMDGSVWRRTPARHGTDPAWDQPAGDWIEEPAPLSFFLLQTLMCEYTLYSAPAMASGVGGNAIPEAEMRRVLAPLTELPYGPWGEWSSRFLVSSEAVLQLTSGGFAWAGAASGSALRALELDPALWDISWALEPGQKIEPLRVEVVRGAAVVHVLEFEAQSDGTSRRWRPTGTRIQVEAGDVLRFPNGPDIEMEDGGQLDGLELPSPLGREGSSVVSLNEAG